MHAKGNLRHHMTKCSMPQAVREKVISLTFGADGISMATDSAAFDARMQCVHQSTDNMATYTTDRIIPKLQNNCELMRSKAWLAQHVWTKKQL